MIRAILLYHKIPAGASKSRERNRKDRGEREGRKAKERREGRETKGKRQDRESKKKDWIRHNRIRQNRKGSSNEKE